MIKSVFIAHQPAEKHLHQPQKDNRALWMLVVQKSGGYDIDLFVETPDQDFICTVCHGVLKYPVMMSCSHIFCKKCILQWLKRCQQETCPCCRKDLKGSTLVLMHKLIKMIGRLKIKCKNEVHGCSVTFPLAQREEHVASCQFEMTKCPNEGCTADVLLKDLDAHNQSCQHWKQPCRMGCGTVLTRSNLDEHNCYQELKKEMNAEKETYRTTVAKLRRKIDKMQVVTMKIRRQLNLICDSLDMLDDKESSSSTESN
ncbi:RING finger protein 151 [Latimeria chalumnae]|uniref:RING finger protein 151 n=1 Tax=Latimeria chalumnae TaxID=7897 RepID=UPI00313DC253